MQFLRLRGLGLVCASLLFATAAEAQFVLPMPAPQPYRPIWEQYTPINVYHYGVQVNQPMSIANRYNGIHAHTLPSTVIGIGPAPATAPTPFLPVQIQPGVTNGRPDGVPVINADQLQITEIPDNDVPFSVTESLAPAPSQTTTIDEDRDRDSNSLKIAHPPAEQPAAAPEDGITDELRKLKLKLARKTKALAKSQEDHKKLKGLLEQQILNAIGEKRDGKSATAEIDKLKKQNAELQALNAQLRQINETSQQAQLELAKQLEEMSGSSSKKQLANQASAERQQNPMTLGELAEIKRKERNLNSATATQGTAQQSAQSVEAEMQSQVTRAVEKIRNRFQQKMDRVSDLDDGSEQVARLEDEMEIQIEKMRNRIKNRFKRRTDPVQQKSKQ